MIKRKLPNKPYASQQRGRSPPPQPTPHSPRSISGPSSAATSREDRSTREDRTILTDRVTLTDRVLLYRKDENTEGKKLTKTQIRKALHSDQSHAKWYNRELTDIQIQQFVGNILYHRGRVDKHYLSVILDEEGTQLFRQAFTHWSMLGDPNYELFEMLGDTTFNKVVVFYMMNRFKELMDDPDANYKLTEASKLYKGRNVADKFSDTLGLPSVARWRNLTYGQSPTKMVEMDNKFKTDLFESFLAAVELIVDKKIFAFAGYSIVYNILASLFDDIEMTVDLRLTKPATAQLKELVDRLHGDKVFINIKTDDNDIIGVRLKLSFAQEGGLATRNGGRVYEQQFESGHIRGKEAGEDKVCQLALKWLDEECNQRW